MHWRRKWQPTPVFLPGESQGWQSLVGCRLWGCTESDTTEAAQQQQPILRLRCQRRVLRGLPCPVCAGPLPRHSADPSILWLMSVQKGWAALSVPLCPDSPGGEQVCHSSGRRRAGVKVTSHSSLGSCLGLGLNPDSQRPAPHTSSCPVRAWTGGPGGTRSVLCASVLYSLLLGTQSRYHLPQKPGQGCRFRGAWPGAG